MNKLTNLIKFHSQIVTRIIVGEERKFPHEFVLDDAALSQKHGDQFLLIDVVIQTTDEHFPA